jgi:DNA-binding NtrC family response regulator
LFRKFAVDFAERNRMPAISLSEDAKKVLVNYRWPGNIRQLKNITEQISIIEENREISEAVLRTYLPDYYEDKLPAVYQSANKGSFNTEREILYKVLFDMKNDMGDLKKLVLEMLQKGASDAELQQNNAQIIEKLYQSVEPIVHQEEINNFNNPLDIKKHDEENIQDTEEIIGESLSIADKEMELIRKALEKHKGKRKNAARELGISERTLYRKIKEYNIND